MAIIQFLGTVSLLLVVIYLLVMVIGGYYMQFSLKGIATRPPKSDAIEQYVFEDVEIKGADNNTLRGWFIKSSTGKSDKTVIIIHGWKHTRATMLPHIHFFVQNGFNVFAYDQRCHGDSDVARLGFGISEGRDFNKVLDYITDMPDVNPQKIVTYGISLGGAAVVCAAPFHERVKAVIWEGPWAFDECMTGYMAEMQFGFVPGVIIKSAMALGAALWGDGRPNHGYPVEYVHNVSPVPILFIRGENDNRVPAPCALAVINAAKEPKEMWFHEKGGHRRAIEYYPDEYKERVLGFIDKHL